MKKCIVIISGDNSGKTNFAEIAKQNGYWVWQTNSQNFLSSIAHQLGWDGVKNKHYYNFVLDFKELANKYWNYERNYTRNMVAKFRRSDKANLLIIHGCKDYNFIQELRKVHDTWVVQIALEEPELPSADYDKVLVVDENYKNSVLAVLNTLSVEE